MEIVVSIVEIGFKMGLSTNVNIQFQNFKAEFAFSKLNFDICWYLI